MPMLFESYRPILSVNTAATVAPAIIIWPALILGRRWSRYGIFICLPAAVFLAQLGLRWHRDGTPDQLWPTTVLMLLHVAVVVAATAAYRLSRFHPLASFPGPAMFKMTNIRLALSVASGYRYIEMEKLHQKYGKIVRIGPNKLSIVSHTALHSMYKSSRCMEKSDAYVLGHEKAQGLFFIQGREEHARRRAVWAPAFSASTLEKHQPALVESISQLTECVVRRKDSEGVVDLGVCFQHWAYDFMGHFTFGSSNSFDMMYQGDPKQLVRGGQLAMVNLETYGEIPWLFKILWYLPLTKSIHALRDLASSTMKKRRDAGRCDVPDVCSYLLGEDGTNSERLTDEDLAIDSLFAIQAGSDTTSGILTFLFFFLLSHPATYAKLQAELDGHFPDRDGPLDPATLASLPFLNAVLKEALRLGTPFGGLARVVPAGGAELEGMHVPGGTVVSVPVYAEHVSAAHFWPAPTQFIPERWLAGGLGPDSVCEEAAWIPFSFGPFGCLGRNLAMRELQAVAARLVLEFDMRLLLGFETEEFGRNIVNMKTTMFRKPLHVVIKLRRQI